MPHTPIYSLRVNPEDRAKTRAAAKLAGIDESELWRSAALERAASIAAEANTLDLDAEAS